MGMMIHDEEIISMLTRLAERDGVSKAEALKRALMNFEPKLCERRGDPVLFPRECVNYRTCTL